MMRQSAPSMRSHVGTRQMGRSVAIGPNAQPRSRIVTGRAPLVAASSSASDARSSAPRLIQHKAEAKAFYAFLSQVSHWVLPALQRRGGVGGTASSRGAACARRA